MSQSHMRHVPGWGTNAESFKERSRSSTKFLLTSIHIAYQELDTFR